MARLDKKRIRNLLVMFKDEIKTGKAKSSTSFCKGHHVTNVFGTTLANLDLIKTVGVGNRLEITWVGGKIDGDLVDYVYEGIQEYNANWKKAKTKKPKLKKQKPKKQKAKSRNTLGMYGNITLDEKAKFDKLCAKRGTKMGDFIAATVRRAICEKDIEFAYYEAPKKKRRWYWPF